MSWSWILNATAADDYDCAWLALQGFVAAGWTVVDSSDGVSNVGAGNVLTANASGAHGIRNPGAWYRIEAGDGVREWTVQVNSGGQRIVYRPQAGASPVVSPGTLTTTPVTAGIQVACIGFGSDASPGYGSFWYRFQRFNAGFDSASGSAQFWLAGFDPGGLYVQTLWSYEPALYAPTSDPDPYMIRAAGYGNRPMNHGNATRDGGAGTSGWLGWNGAATQYQWKGAAELVVSGQSVSPAEGGVGLGANPFTGLVDLCPVLVAGRNGYSSSGFKGVSSLYRGIGTNVAGTSIVLLNNGAIPMAFFASEGYCLPWDGVTPLVV